MHQTATQKRSETRCVLLRVKRSFGPGHGRAAVKAWNRHNSTHRSKLGTRCVDTVLPASHSSFDLRTCPQRKYAGKRQSEAQVATTADQPGSQRRDNREDSTTGSDSGNQAER